MSQEDDDSHDSDQDQEDPERDVLASLFRGVPFDPDFFTLVLPERVGAMCPGADDVAVVLLHLVDGVVLDVCHVAQLTPRWVAIAAFRDAASCEDMDVHFVPYQAIHRVTVSARTTAERTIGFRGVEA